MGTPGGSEEGPEEASTVGCGKRKRAGGVSGFKEVGSMKMASKENPAA